MQWGVLRARASRPPQQQPGLAGSRMLRPPRAPLAVPRCPHHPHGGRLSQPEALQQGSKRGGGEMERQGQPTSAGEGGGRDAVCSAHSPLVHPGGSTSEGAGAWCLRRPRCGSSVPGLITRAPLRGVPESGSPRLATHEKLGGNLQPHPLPPPQRRLLGVVRPGAAEPGGGAVGGSRKGGGAG